MPGLWDCHAHFMGTRSLDLSRVPQEPVAVRAARTTRDLRAALYAGITSVREVGGLGVYLATAIATSLSRKGGVALFVDYGHERTNGADTLQAVRGHCFAPILADPGEQDLTSHVDFQALAAAANAAGARTTGVVTQGEWLMRLGIEARAQALSRANPDRADDVQSALDRLTSADQMGQLFKVIAIHSPDWPRPAGFA